MRQSRKPKNTLIPSLRERKKILRHGFKRETSEGIMVNEVESLKLDGDRKAGRAAAVEHKGGRWHGYYYEDRD